MQLLRLQATPRSVLWLPSLCIASAREWWGIYVIIFLAYPSPMSPPPGWRWQLSHSPRQCFLQNCMQAAVVEGVEGRAVKSQHLLQGKATVVGGVAAVIQVLL